MVYISKEEFVNSVNAIKNFMEFTNCLYELGIDILDNNACSDLLIQMVRLLSLSVGDDIYNNYGDLAYYIWDLNFGIDWHEGCVTDVDGNDIKMETVDDMWNYFNNKPLN